MPGYRGTWQHLRRCDADREDVPYRLAPHEPGVYAIYAKGGVLRYIGSSQDLRTRLSAHRCTMPFVLGLTPYTVKFAVTPIDWVKRERRLIERLAPPANRQWNPRKRWEPMLPPQVGAQP